MSQKKRILFLSWLKLHRPGWERRWWLEIGPPGFFAVGFGPVALLERFYCMGKLRWGNVAALREAQRRRAAE